MEPYISKVVAAVNEPTFQVPKELFRFCSTDTKFFRHNAIELLLHNRIRLSSPAEFNDPLDSSVLFSPATTEDLERVRSGSSRPDLSESDIHNVARKSISSTGIYCLARNIGDPLMWSHYANGHRGIAFVFSVPRQAQIAAMPVQYEEHPQPVRIGDSVGLVDSLLSKGLCWKYEDEWRIVRILEARKWIEVPKDLLLGIAFGCRCSDDDREFLLDLVARRESAGLAPLKLANAVVDPSTFKVELEELK